MAPLPTNPDELLQRAGDGDRRALARALSIVERGGPSGAALIRATWVQGRGDGAPEQAFTVGITGAPGAGKSTLSASLCGELLRRDRSVAVLAIDPSSPFSGGAILGDRVRMGDVAGDDDVYIRSMATRGNLGGLAGATNDAVAVLGATGRDWVVVETVGVGQVETDIVDAADTTVVVVNPGWGDAIQANKAGLMEIADVFVVNKSDRDGARQTVTDLESMLNISGMMSRPDEHDGPGAEPQSYPPSARPVRGWPSWSTRSTPTPPTSGRPESWPGAGRRTAPNACVRWPPVGWERPSTACSAPSGGPRCAPRSKVPIPTRGVRRTDCSNGCLPNWSAGTDVALAVPRGRA